MSDRLVWFGALIVAPRSTPADRGGQLASCHGEAEAALEKYHAS